MDIASTNQEHNLQTQVQLFVSSWILKNHELQVQSPFALAIQETLPDQYFYRMEDWCIYDLPWLMHMQQQANMWYRIICGTLTISPLLPTEALMFSYRSQK